VTQNLNGITSAICFFIVNILYSYQTWTDLVQYDNLPQCLFSYIIQEVQLAQHNSTLAMRLIVLLVIFDKFWKASGQSWCSEITFNSYVSDKWICILWFTSIVFCVWKDICDSFKCNLAVDKTVWAVVMHVMHTAGLLSRPRVKLVQNVQCITVLTPSEYCRSIFCYDYYYY